MKKILFWGAAALLAAVSCNKELENTTPVLPEGDRVSFVATVDGAETKTVMGDIDVKGKSAESLWDGIEAIRVLDGTVSKEFKSENVSKVKTATFTENDNAVVLTGDDYLAVYPAAPAGSVSWSGDIAEPLTFLWLTDNQKAVQNSFDPSAHIAVAYAEVGNNDLYFKNVVSLISFTIGSDNVSEVRISGNNNEIIAGNFDLTYDPALESITIDANGETYYKATSVSLTAGEGNLSKGKVYYVALLPNDFTDGITVETFIDGVPSSKKTKAFELKRNAVVNLGLVEWEEPVVESGQDSEWALAGDFNSWTDVVMKTTSKYGIYVAENIEFSDYSAFLIKAVGNWDTKYGRGIKYLNENSYMDVTLGGENIFIDKVGSSCDVYFDEVHKRVYLVSNGGSYIEATYQSSNGEGPQGVNVYLTGGADNLGNWTPANGIQFIDGEDFYEAKNVEFGATTQWKVVIEGEWYNASGSFSQDSWNLIKSSSGANFSLNKGTYDFYITKKQPYEIYVTTAGSGKPEQPSTNRTIYLNPGPWTADNAWFIAYTWGGASSEAMVRFIESTKGNNIYECNVPKDRTNIILLRKNPANNNLDWDGEWNRFEMELPADKNCFTVTDWENGNWSMI